MLILFKLIAGNFFFPKIPGQTSRAKSISAWLEKTSENGFAEYLANAEFWRMFESQKREGILRITAAVSPIASFRSMSGNRIQYLPDKSFSGNKKLTILRLKNNPIMSVGLKAFANLPRLENLWVQRVYICSEVKVVRSSPCQIVLQSPVKNQVTHIHTLTPLSLSQSGVWHLAFCFNWIYCSWLHLFLLFA